MSFSTADYFGRQVYLTTDETDDCVTVKKIGRLHHFIFTQNKCVGVLVKRPDVALMFHRKDIFAPLAAINFQTRTIILDADYEKQGNEFLKQSKIKLTQTFVYDGMTVQCESGRVLGCIDSVVCSSGGQISSIQISDGATSDKLLGLRTLPAELLIGMKSGTGAARLVSTDGGEDEGVGVFVVKDEAENVKLKGGATQKLAVGTIKAKNKAAETAVKAKDKAMPMVSKGKDKAVDLAKKGAAKAKEKATPVLEGGKDAAVDLAEEGAMRVKEKAERDTEEFKKGFSGFKEEFKKAYSGANDGQEKSDSN